MGTAITAISDVLLSLSATLDEEFGDATADAGDPTGTVINFTKSFFDVRSIQLTPNNASSVFMSYDFDFSAVPSATSFEVFAYDENGVRVTTDFTYWVKGVVDLS